MDTPALREAKVAAQIRDCSPGSSDTKLPDVTLSCLGGGPDVNLSSLQGPLILNFWNAPCQPCRTETPIFAEFDRRYGDQVTVMGIDSIDTVPGLAIELAGKRGATYPQLADPDGILGNQTTFARSNLGHPYTAFIAADGTLAGQVVGPVHDLSELTGLVAKYLDVDVAVS